MGNLQLYDQDFYAWANEQAGLLRAGRLSEADIEHIAEEIESMGKSEKRELVSRLTVLLVHLLRWRSQPAFRGNSWRLTIEDQRAQLGYHMADNPSLASSLEETVKAAYHLATLGAMRESGLDRSTFPSICPWSYGQMMDTGFWPEAT